MESNGENRTEEALRIAKMISEGGLGVEAYYYYQDEENDEKEDDDSDPPNMISIGGIGTGAYIKKKT